MKNGLILCLISLSILGSICYGDNEKQSNLFLHSCKLGILSTKIYIFNKVLSQNTIEDAFSECVKIQRQQEKGNLKKIKGNNILNGCDEGVKIMLKISKLENELNPMTRRVKKSRSKCINSIHEQNLQMKLHQKLMK